jgi:uncharacterized phage protein (TIGR02216 family)
MKPERIDWDNLMRLGLGVLRLEPDAFWGMTPIELLRALEGSGVVPVGGTGLRRSGLERLMAAYPDVANSPDAVEINSEKRGEV